MRFSCNGCRVLRRGCNPNCPIRSSLQWIKSPISQSNATLFLAKFYGRAALHNLLSAAPPPLRPSLFKSLLYDACGRFVNPVFGSTGLLSTGSWHLCEAAVQAVLAGKPIQQAPSTDIRHVAKSGKSCGSNGFKSRRSRFKRSAVKPMMKVDVESVELVVGCSGSELGGSVSRDSVFEVSERGSVGVKADDSAVESVEPAPAEERGIELELTLGWGPVNTS